MRWACILLPQLALDHALRQRDDPQTPLALLSGPANRRVLQALNPAARELGLRPGMALNAAQTSSCSSRGASKKFWLMPMQNRTRRAFFSVITITDLSVESHR